MNKKNVGTSVFLKKFFTVFLAVLCFCLLFSCGGADESSSREGTTASLASSAVTSTADVTSTVEEGSTATPDSSSGAPTDSSSQAVSDTPADTASDTTSPITTTSLETVAPGPDPVSPALFDGVIIHSVYGTGKKAAEAVIAHGYVQLYNESDKDISLAGAALYYKTDNGEGYTEFRFADDAVIPKEGYYLIRGAGPADFVAENAIMGIEHADAEWGAVIDNKEVTLILAPAYLLLDPEKDVSEITGINSIFHASETLTDFHYAVTDLSRNKIAVRTASTAYSPFHLVNLTKTLSSDLDALRTRTSDGKVNEVLSHRLEEVTFTHGAGFYDQSVILGLTAPEGFTIYYTTDGSDPSDTLNTARKVYSTGIFLGTTASMGWGKTIKAWNRYHGSATPNASGLLGAHVVKAYAVNGAQRTAVFTNTYFITSGIETYGVPVMCYSIPTEKMISANGFYSNFMPSGSITATRPRGLGVMEVFDENGNRVGVSNVEAAVSGNGSSGFAMKSLRLYYKGSLNEEGGMHKDLEYDLFAGLARDKDGDVITTFDRLLLRNSGNDCGTSYIRDAYMQRVSAGLSVDTMASRSVLLFVNGEFWGVYNARERYSPEYVESHYGVNKDFVALIENDYSQVHTNQNAPYVVSSGMEGDADDFNELVSYLKRSDLTDPEVYAYVKTRMDVDSFIDLWVVRLYFNAVDWPENNVKVWRNVNPDDPNGYQRWHFTLLDLDMGLSFYGHTTETASIFGAFNRGSVCGNMMCDLIRNEEFKNQFLVRYYEVVTEHFTPTYLSQVFEELYQERSRLMPLQEARWGREGASVSRWNSTSNDIRRFIANRNQHALNALYNHFGVNQSYIENLAYRRVTVSFNPTRADVTVNGEAVVNGKIIKFETGEQVFRIEAVARPGYLVTGITFVDQNMKSHTVEGTSATFYTASSGSITVHTKRLESSEEDLSKGTLVAGPTYLFYLTEQGDLYAWGDNRSGVLGLGYAGGTVSEPTFVMSNVAKVATTAAAAYQNNDTVFMTAILTADGKLYTVGNNTCGQLGRNGSNDSFELKEISFSRKVADVSVGYDHMLVIDEAGSLWGVGSNSYGQLGSQLEGGNVFAFQKIADHVEAVAGGRRSTAFIGEDGILYGLGDNRWKKLSQVAPERTNTPCVMLENAVFLSSGEHQVLVVNENGDLFYAGRRDFASFQLGNGNNPTMQKVMSSVKEAYAYFDNMVILAESGEVYVYGLNTGGAMGSSAATGRVPKLLADGIVKVASGYGFTALLTDDGRILIQGDNTFGQAGNGTVGGSVFMAECEF